jgi:hypothetical protein
MNLRRRLRQTTQLEQYSGFVADDAIRQAGTRVGFETVVADYEEGVSPEEIALRYPTLSPEQIHPAIPRQRRL